MTKPANYMSREEYLAQVRGTTIMGSASKYSNKKVIYDGIVFDSTGEGNRYLELKLLQTSGHITELEIKPKYDLTPTIRLGDRTWSKTRFTPDFKYFDCDKGITVIEEYKGCKTEAYQIRLKIFLALHVVGKDDVEFKENIHRG